MKIAIITFHNTSNFGATLQCSALSRYLTKLGHEVIIIDYLPKYVLDKKSVFKEMRKIGKSHSKIKAIIKGVAYVAYTPDIKRRNEKFETFIQNNLVLTSTYNSYNSLKENPPYADFYICGSDQIWNPSLTGGKLDYAFFLQFVNKNKAAYGASMGEFDIEAESNKIEMLVENFSGISVREKSIAARLSKVVGTNVDVVLDCTLLLEKKDYSCMEGDMPRLNHKYVLLYNVQNSDDAITIAKKISDDHDLSIIDISPNPFAKVKGAKKMIDIGPGEFLALFKHAEYVVTNSFHGTVFSLIYEKKFFSLAHSTRGGRVIDLLDSLDLKDRLVKCVEEINDKPVDYEKVNRLLAIFRQNSFEYINRILP